MPTGRHAEVEMKDQLTSRIRVMGQLGPEWSGWFAGLEVTALGDGTTELSGDLPDQAALYGLIAAIRDLGLSLISVETASDLISPSGPGR